MDVGSANYLSVILTGILIGTGDLIKPSLPSQEPPAPGLTEDSTWVIESIEETDPGPA